jgi:hypothetical protein
MKDRRRGENFLPDFPLRENRGMGEKRHVTAQLQLYEKVIESLNRCSKWTKVSRFLRLLGKEIPAILAATKVSLVTFESSPPLP